MQMLGDFANFARTKGAKDKRRRRRRYGEAAAATTAIGGGGLAGAKGANKLADLGYQQALETAYQKTKGKNPFISRVLPERLPNKFRDGVARRVRAVVQKRAPLLTKIPSVNASRAARLGIAVAVKPGRAGAISGVAAGAGLYGGYRTARYGVYQARGGSRRRRGKS